ncbi:MAG TPA: 4-hydroxy-tetrahydrodipicolinate reductase, partial [Chitinophagales bacterium]|nr:4-hydroxy-tetrahydrodipicolinate reductase [Chitinophagales bacterium]
MKIALIGYGKMGKAIESLLQNYPDLQIVARYNSQNAHELTIENLRKADLAIEFTRPELAPNH